VVVARTLIWQIHGKVHSMVSFARGLAVERVMLFTTCTMLARTTYQVALEI